MSNFKTAEAVTEGHPDKICDLIADSILDETIKLDPDCHVACEVMATKGNIIVAGEISAKSTPDINKIVRETLENVGYNPAEYKVTNLTHAQSKDIERAVNKQHSENIGAGDQGIVYGYATNETDEYLPLPFVLAQKLTKRLTECYKIGLIPYLKPDGKSQVTVQYDDFDKPISITSIIISAQHRDNITQSQIRDDIMKYVIKPTMPNGLMKVKTKIDINPSGRFVEGGPSADTGLTGRKIMVDSYGGLTRFGGGAFCVDGDTEFLTPQGYKNIRDYTENDMVGQWNQGKLEFVKPQSYIVCKADKMYRIWSPTALDMVLSENHDMVLITSKGNPIKKQVKQMFPNGVLKTGNHGFVPVAFNYFKSESNVFMTDDEIRLQVAFCADGTLLSGKRGRIRIKKMRKINRLTSLLEKTNTEYKISEDGEFKIFYFKPFISSKVLKDCFEECNTEQLRVIADEVLLWDGDEKKKVFRTTKKVDADFIQFVFMAVHGTNSSIVIDDRIWELYNNDQYIRKSICYAVYIKNNKTTQIKESEFTNNQMSIDLYYPTDGLMYCFSVDSGMLVLRRNNKVFVTGNSGKDSTKVDRSGAYFARYVAKNIVVAGLADKCEVAVSYAIGKAEPTSISIDTFGTGKIFDGCILKIITKLFDFRPSAIIKKLDLKKPIYSKTAVGGHFGRSEFPWEKVDRLYEIYYEVFI